MPYFFSSLSPQSMKGTSSVLVGIFPDRRLYLEKVRTQSAERGNERIIWTAKYQQVPIPFNEVPEGQPRTLSLACVFAPYKHKTERLNGDVLVNHFQVGKPEQLRAPVLQQYVHDRVFRLS